MPLATRFRQALGRRWWGTFLYDDGHGVKATRYLPRHVPLARFGLEFPTLTVPLRDLRLAMDGLRDAHSLTGQGVADSPHRDLMERLRDGRRIDGCDYVERARTGRLDARPPQRTGPAFLRRLQATYAERLRMAEAGTLPPIKVIRAGGRTSVADGKHAAALLLDVQDEAPAVDVTPLAYDSFYWWMRERMLRRPAEFQKNLEYFESLLRRP